MLENDFFEEEYDAKIWINPSENPQKIKYSSLIGNLENLVFKYSNEDYEWLKSDQRTYKFGYENNQFHYFIYCIDWSEIYSTINVRLTLYDILIESNSESVATRKKIFNDAYFQLKKLFDGNINNSEELKNCRDTVLKRVTEGLTQLQSKGHNSKGLNEFFKMIFDKIGNVDYDVADFSKPYLTGDSQRSRFINDVFDKFIPAFEVTKSFNKEYSSKVTKVKINRFFALHVLLRHTASFKLKYIFAPILSGVIKIKDGIDRQIDVTAHLDSDGSISVMSEDGEFYLPDFTIDEKDFTDYMVKGGKLNIDEIANNLYEKLNNLVTVFVDNINSDFSPNIVFFEQALYGFEFTTWRYIQDGTIDLGSFYPLNSEYQLNNGISQIDYDRITNKSEIPDSFEIKIEN